MPQGNPNTIRYTIRILNWDKWQEKAKPKGNQWIKIATNLPHDPEFFRLTIEQRYLWVMLLCHAGVVGPVFKLSPSDARVLFKLRRNPDFSLFVDQGFIAPIEEKRVEESRREEIPIEQQAALPVDNSSRSRSTSSGYSVGFERFWAAYPNKKGKAKAFAAWNRHRCEPHTDALIDNVELRLRQDDQWLKDGGKFIPHGSTWLAGKRWEDEIEAPRAPAGKNDALMKRLLG